MCVAFSQRDPWKYSAITSAHCHCDYANRSSACEHLNICMHMYVCVLLDPTPAWNSGCIYCIFFLSSFFAVFQFFFSSFFFFVPSILKENFNPNLSQQIRHRFFHRERLVKQQQQRWSSSVRAAAAEPQQAVWCRPLHLTQLCVYIILKKEGLWACSLNL